ncbi:MAG: SDR family NAD(P)-dependent oxidoreductase [Treponema sp.]|jgi:sorbitol-6-phosphate 2-dehydrogenase|nr:SDR family NAD(P)-dependent oxidoreductase [Treponema sp.]
MSSPLLSVLAPLVRGICINALNAPCVAAADTGSIPKGALVVDLSPAFDQKPENETGNGFDAVTAAKIINEAYAAREFENAPSGADAAQAQLVKKVPSCIALSRGIENLGLFWIDRDIDAVSKRKAGRDDSFIEETLSGNESLFKSGLSALCRNDVVKNRVALVSGGAQGFGEQIVLGLASSGALVFIADLNIKGAEELAKKINAELGRTAAIAAPLDVTKEDSASALFDTIAKTTGGLDLCISNAGVLQAGSVMEQELASFKFTTEVNYVGFFIMAKFASRLMSLQHLTSPAWKTDIIQINSKSGLEGSNKNGAYAGAKFGGIGLAESFALELIAHNIKVNAVCPGNFLDGPLWSDPEKGLFVQYLAAGKVPGARSVADVRAFYEGKVPMRRGCTGADVMRTIYYIVEQDYETGQAVPVTGGQNMLH